MLTNTNLAYGTDLSHNNQSRFDTQTTSNKVVKLRPCTEVSTAASEDVPPPWQVAALKQITVLVNMPDNWDGYGAPTVDRQVGMFALEVLHKLMSDGAAEPYIVPSSAGGVQLEWHRNSIDLEIHVTAPYEAETYYFNHHSGAEQEFMLSDNVAAVAPILKQLSR